MRASHVLLLVLLQICHVHGSFNFNNYPQCAQAQCYDLAPPSCDYGSDTDAEAAQTDACLCTNSGFIADLSSGIFHTCGCQDLTTSAQVFSDNCAKYGTISVISVQDFIAEGDGGHSSCGSTTLDPGAIVGIVFGIIAFLSLVIAILQLVVALIGLPERYQPWHYIRRFCCCCVSERHRPVGQIPLPPYGP